MGSPNDVTQQIEKTLNNTHTTTKKQINNGFRNIKKLPKNHSEKIQTRKFPSCDVSMVHVILSIRAHSKPKGLFAGNDIPYLFD